MMYTWRELISTLNNPLRSCEITERIHALKELFKYVDIIVDGEYNQMETVWDGTKEDGLLSSVGSGNQIIWNIKNKVGFAMRDIESMHISEKNNLIYMLKKTDCKCHHLKY